MNDLIIYFSELTDTRDPELKHFLIVKISQTIIKWLFFVKFCILLLHTLSYVDIIILVKVVLYEY